MKKLLCVLVLGVSLGAVADPGRDAAVSICEALPFPSDQTDCLKAIQGKAFDPKAIAACKSLPFASDKLSCLQVIANRYFTSEREVQLCARQPFASNRIDCLRNCDTRPLATGPIGELDPEALRRLVIEAKRAVRRRDYYDALQILEDLEAELEAASDGHHRRHR